MTKTELVAKIAEKAEISKKEADKILAVTLDSIKDVLVEGDKLALLGFGTFGITARKAREGKNPLTGEKIKIKASKAVTFKAGKSLKEAVNAPKKTKK